MARTNVTLQPTKKTITLAAAQIYAAYISAGWLDDSAEPSPWLERAVREAIAIGHQVDVTVQSDEELPDDGRQRLRHLPEDEDIPKVRPAE